MENLSEVLCHKCKTYFAISIHFHEKVYCPYCMAKCLNRKQFDFKDLSDDIRDMIIEDIKEYNPEVDDLIFKIAKREKYDEDGDIIE